MSAYDWKTQMYRDDDRDHQGQAALVVHDDGRITLTVMAAPGTFATACTLSAGDRESLRAFLNGEKIEPAPAAEPLKARCMWCETSQRVSPAGVVYTHMPPGEYAVCPGSGRRGE